MFSEDADEAEISSLFVEALPEESSVLTSTEADKVAENCFLASFCFFFEKFTRD